MARLLPPRRRDGNKWSAAVLVVAGSPGMTGAAALCARVGLPGRGRHGPPGRARGRTWPTRRPPRRSASPCRRTAGRPRRPGGRLPLRGRGGRPRPRPGPVDRRRGACAWWPSRRCRWWSTPTVCYALGPGGRRRSRSARPGPGGGAHPPRRRVRPAHGRPTRAPTGSPPPVGWPPPPGRWPCSRGRPRRWPTPTAGSGWPGRDHRAGHGRHRRRPVRGHRGHAGPRCRPARGGRPGRPRPRPGRRPGAGGGAGGRRPARAGGPCVDLRPIASGARPRTGLARPWLSAGGRPGPTSTSTPCATTPRLLSGLAGPAALCAVVKADGYGHGDAAGGPGRPRGRRHLAGRGPGGGGGRPCARPASRRPSSCCPSRRRRRWPRRWPAGWSRPSTPPEGSRPWTAPWPTAGSRRSRSTSRSTPGCTGSGADPADVAGPGRRHRAPTPAWRSARCGPTWPWPTAPSPTTGDFTAAQLDRFDAVLADLAAAGHRPPMTHVANSAGDHRRPRRPARPGPLRHRRLRGGPDPGPGRELAAATGGGRLRPVLSLRSRVTYVRDLDAGERPSYGRRRPLTERSTVATVPIGYADGVPRRLFDQGGEVLIGGRPPAAGRGRDHGPDRGRLRPGRDRRRWRWVTRWSCIGRQGDRGDHRRRVGRSARHHQLRGAVRHRAPGAPASSTAPSTGRPRRPSAVAARTVARAPRRRPARPAGPLPAGPADRQYHAAVAPGTDLAELAREAAGCTRCPLSAGRTQVVFGVGDPDADLMFVGEAPGRDEDLQGEPFVGRSGKLLDRLLLEELGVDRGRVLHRQRGQVPAAGQPRPEARRDRRVPALPRAPSWSSSPPTVVVTLGQLRHQAPARDRPRHHQGAGPVLPDGRMAAGPDLPPGGRPAVRGRGRGRDAGRPDPGQAAPRAGAREPDRCRWSSGRRQRRRAPGPWPRALAGAVRPRRRPAAGRRPRRRQDDLRPGVRGRARGDRAHHQSHLHPGPPVCRTAAWPDRPEDRAAGGTGGPAIAPAHADVYRLDHLHEIVDLGLGELVEDGGGGPGGVGGRGRARPRARTRSPWSWLLSRTEPTPTMRPTPTDRRADVTVRPGRLVDGRWQAVVGVARPAGGARDPPGHRVGHRHGRRGPDPRRRRRRRADPRRRSGPRRAAGPGHRGGLCARPGAPSPMSTSSPSTSDPGLFTGLRVGVATAKALGQALWARRCIGVCSLDILAAAATERLQTGAARRSPARWSRWSTPAAARSSPPPTDFDGAGTAGASRQRRRSTRVGPHDRLRAHRSRRRSGPGWWSWPRTPGR